MSGPAIGGGSGGDIFGGLFGRKQDADIQQNVPGYTVVRLPGNRPLQLLPPASTDAAGNVYAGGGDPALISASGKHRYQYRWDTPEGIRERANVAERVNRLKLINAYGTGTSPGAAPIPDLPPAPGTVATNPVAGSDVPTRLGQRDAYVLAMRSGVPWHIGDTVAVVRANILQKQYDAQARGAQSEAAQSQDSAPPAWLTSSQKAVWYAAKRQGVPWDNTMLRQSDLTNKIRDMAMSGTLTAAATPNPSEPWNQAGMNQTQKQAAKTAFESQTAEDQQAGRMPVWWDRNLSKGQVDMFVQTAARTAAGYPETFTDMPKRPPGMAQVPGEPDWMYRNMPKSDLDAVNAAWDIAKTRMDQIKAREAKARAAVLATQSPSVSQTKDAAANQAPQAPPVGTSRDAGQAPIQYAPGANPAAALPRADILDDPRFNPQWGGGAGGSAAGGSAAGGSAPTISTPAPASAAPSGYKNPSGVLDILKNIWNGTPFPPQGPVTPNRVEGMLRQPTDLQTDIDADQKYNPLPEAIYG